jgi:hypothetical protein
LGLSAIVNTITFQPNPVGARILVPAEADFCSVRIAKGAFQVFVLRPVWSLGLMPNPIISKRLPLVDLVTIGCKSFADLLKGKLFRQELVGFRKLKNVLGSASGIGNQMPKH